MILRLELDFIEYVTNISFLVWRYLEQIEIMNTLKRIKLKT